MESGDLEANPGVAALGQEQDLFFLKMGMRKPGEDSAFLRGIPGRTISPVWIRCAGYGDGKAKIMPRRKWA